MKRILTISILLLAVIITATADRRRLLMKQNVPTGPAATYLINQNFEGTGYDNGETSLWTESGSINEDYATSPAPLVGSQSCRIIGVEFDYINVVADHTDGAELWAYFQVNLAKIEDRVWAGFYNAAGTTARLNITFASGALTITSGSATATTVGTMTTATTYHVWLHYRAGSGANGFGEIGFSTDGTKPTSGNNYASFSNSDSTGDAAVLYFLGSSGGASDVEMIIDRVLVDDVSIGSNP